MKAVTKFLKKPSPWLWFLTLWFASLVTMTLVTFCFRSLVKGAIYSQQSHYKTGQ